MDVMARRPAHFPDTLVGFTPMRGDELGDGGEQAPILLVEMAAESLVHQREIQDLPVRIDLQLQIRAVAGAHWCAAFVAFEMIERLLFELQCAVDSVHRPHVRQRTCARAQQIIVEALRFAAVAEHRQCVQRERAVAHPAVAIVPVTFAADLFGQRRGGCGDHGAGGRKGQHLQRERATHDRVLIRTAITAVTDPLLPKRLRDL